MSESEPTQLKLGDPTLTLAERFEEWLFRRLPNLSPRLFEDPPCLSADARRDRVRTLILVRKLESSIAGRGPNGKTETFAAAYQRVYGRPLFDHHEPKTVIDVDLRQRCPHDGGYCHHKCQRSCWRKSGGAALSSPHPGFPVPGDKPVKEDLTA